MEYHVPTAAENSLDDIGTKVKQLIGELRYISDSTRPEINYVVCRLGAALSKTSEGQWGILNAKLRYLKCTRNYWIYFRKQENNQGIKVAFNPKPIRARVDADWDKDQDDRSSITCGYKTIHG